MNLPPAWIRISSRRLDDPIATLAESMGATVVMVTHELDSIFAIATQSIYLDNESRTLLDQGPPLHLKHTVNTRSSGSF